MRRTVEPVSLPITLNEAERALQFGDISDTSLDAEIEELIPVAVDMVERDCQRALCPQTWQLKLDQFPVVIELRRPPITAASVTYLDEDEASQTLSSSLYDTDLTSAPGLITPDDLSWPVVGTVPAAVTVTFTAGYAGKLPPAAWNALRLALKAVYYGCDPGDAYWSMIGRLDWSAHL